jgi:hypothetical protein
MKIWKRLCGRFAMSAIALALTLAVCGTGAKAATVDLGQVSSTSGLVPILGGLGVDPSNSYTFMLTDHAQVSGGFSAFVVFSLSGSPVLTIDLTDSGAVTLAHTTATADILISIFPPISLPGTPGSFSLADLGPGGYSLTLGGITGGYSGSLTFAKVGATPIPAALPLFASALTGLGVLGWRRKKTAAA